jgi:hypothetical protein
VPWRVVGDRKEGETNVRKGVKMHIRALTRKCPEAAETNVVVFILDAISAILGVISQINALIVNINAKNTPAA